MAIFGSSQTEPGSKDWVEAEAAGARCAEAGLTVITGGYGGTMEAASRGAKLQGGRVIGVTAPELFQGRSGANPHVDQEIQAKTLTERIGILIELANGALVLPGSIGTAAELLIAWNINHIVRRNGGVKLPTVTVGEEWAEFTRLLTTRLYADGNDIHIAATTDEAVDWILGQPEIG